MVEVGDLSSVLDTCLPSSLLQPGHTLTIARSGTYTLTFTSLMKAVSGAPLSVSVWRARENTSRLLLGSTGLQLNTSSDITQEVGLSSSLVVQTSLLAGDRLELSLDTANPSTTFLRSSDWKLVRLEGHLSQPGKPAN